MSELELNELKNLQNYILGNEMESENSSHSGNPMNSGSDNVRIRKTAEEFKDCTSRIIGCAMRVHSTLGNGFQEVIYQKALAIEMRLEDLEFQREWKCPYFIEMSN